MSIIERAIRRLKPGGDEEASPGPEIRPEPPRAQPVPTLPTQELLESKAGSATPPPPGDAEVDGPFETIDLAKLESDGMIVPHGKRTQLSEEFRAIKRPLLQNVRQRGVKAVRKSNLILVTSAFPNEGKTFSSINLAMSMSLEPDHSVLLIDADVAKPRSEDFLGLSPRPGLMDLLLDPKLRLADVAIRTNVDRLQVLLAGRAHLQANELLASESMSRLLDELAAKPDRIVIFDAPPLLVTTEAAVLAQRVGQVVVVVEAGKTAQAAVKTALAQIDGCRVFGLLNKSTNALGENQFNYGRYGESE